MRNLASALALVAAIAAGHPAAAQTFLFVDPANVCEGHTPCFTTIQAAVNAAQDGDIVAVYPGTYAESVDVSAMAVIGNIVLVGPVVDFDDLLPASPAIVEPAMPDTAFAEILRPSVEKFQALLSRVRLPPRLPADAANLAAAVQLARVESPGGPAFYNSVIPHPGFITLIGFSVLSPDDDGVRLSARGRLQVQLVEANMNAGRGLNLASTDDEVAIIGCTANDNVQEGILAVAKTEVGLMNGVVQDNGKTTGAAGVSLTSLQDVSVFGFSAEVVGAIFDPDLFLDGLNVSGNGGHGIVVSALGDVRLSGLPDPIFGDFDELDDLVSGLTVTDNDMDGMNLTGEAVAVFFSTSTLNQQNGMTLTSDDDTIVIVSRSNRNMLHGVAVTAGDALLVLGSTASRNGRTGVAASTSGSDSLFFGGTFGAQVSGLNATGNAIGAEFNLTGGGLFLDSAAVLGNTVDGIVLTALTGDDSRVSGGIICGNQGAGLRSNVDAEVYGVANWWGDPSGPSHAAKNPTGLGDAVVDLTSGGGMGDVTLAPFIDTVTASIEHPVVVSGQPATLEFRFTGANGTVFMGLTAAFEGGGFVDPPLVVSTTNGAISIPLPFVDGEAKGNPLAGFVNSFEGDFPIFPQPPFEGIPVLFRAKVIPAQIGEGTVDLNGPCGLTASVEFTAVPLTAPLLPAPALAVLALLLASFGVYRLSSRRD